MRRALAAERERRLVVLEVGAGSAVPSVRNEAESYLEPQAAHRQCTVVRINPTPVRGDNSTPGVLSIAWGAEPLLRHRRDNDNRLRGRKIIGDGQVNLRVR